MSLVDKELIDWIISILLLPDSAALKDPIIFKIIQTTCMTTNLLNVLFLLRRRRLRKLDLFWGAGFLGLATRD